jgi:hypothetical protein
MAAKKTPTKKAPALFICQAKDVRGMYIQQRAGSWAELGAKKTAMQKPKAWWARNMTAKAKEYYKLVPVAAPKAKKG